MQQLINKKAIITGGSQGIGKAIALALAKAGSDVIIQYNKSKDKAYLTVKEIENLGRKAVAIHADFSQKESSEKFIDAALNQFSTIDILINSAAGYEESLFLAVKKESFAKIYRLNIEVPLILIQKVASHLISRTASGSIINISSISSLMPSFGSCLSSCSKASLNMLTKCSALELAQYNIRVNAIALGTTNTESNFSYIKDYPEKWQEYISKIPLKRAGQPEDCTEMVVLLASDAASWITGTIIPCDGGTTLIYQ